MACRARSRADAPRQANTTGPAVLSVGRANERKEGERGRGERERGKAEKKGRSGGRKKEGGGGEKREIRGRDKREIERGESNVAMFSNILARPIGTILRLGL